MIIAELIIMVNFLDYFVRSALDMQEYNMVNTLLYALVFAGGIYFIYEWIIKGFKLNIDRNFLFAASMWAFFAVSIRLLYDTGFTKSVWFITPYVTLIDFGLAISTLFVSVYVQRKKNIEYWKIWGASGAILGIILLSLSPLRNWGGFGIVALLWLTSFALLVGARKIFPKFLIWWNISVLQAGLMDSIGTFFGITFFGFSEEHVLGRSVIAYAESIGLALFGSGAWAALLLNVLVLIPILYYIDKSSEDIQETKYIKTIIFVLALAMGLRNGFNILILEP